METLNETKGTPTNDTTAEAKLETLVKTKTLTSGKVATITPFLGKDIRTAQRMIGDDPEKLIWAIICVTTTIDGKSFVIEDIDSMNGWDVMDLMAEFNGNFTQRQNK